MERGRGLDYPLLSRYRGELMGLAMLWVMAFHAYQFSFGVPALDAVKELGYGGVDVFLLLSGMGVYISLSRGRGFWTHVRRRFARILPAYWLVVGGYGLWQLWAGKAGLKTVAWNLSTLYYWFHIPNTFNWYIPSLLALYLLAPAYGALLRRCRSREGLVLAVFLLSHVLYKISLPLGFHHLLDFISHLPAFALGSLIGLCLVEEKPLDGRRLAGWGLLCLLGLGALELRRLWPAQYMSTCLVITAFAVPGCLALAWLLDRLPWDGPQAVLRLLGECSLEIYLLNVILTREYGVLRALAPGLSNGRYYLAAYLLNILLGVGLHRLLPPLSAWLSGEEGKREKSRLHS